MAIARRGSWQNLGGRPLELAAYAAILLLAAGLRLGNLAARGTWDADQGHDMLVLRALVLDGRIPLLGPPTSIGDFHHGVLYYLLLAPAAALSHADPVAVTTWIALGGIAAVAVTGWLARSIAGPVAGIVAALLLAVSASAVDESIFIWNPNLIALSSSVALAAAWHAWRAERPRWWLGAGAAAVVTMHCHVLGVILTPVVGGLLVADLRRRRRRGDGAGAAAVGRAAVGWLGLAILSYVPLAVHEIGNDASELRAAFAFVAGGGAAASISLPLRVPIVGLRVLGWPIAGLITAAPLATVLGAVLVVAIAAWRGWPSGRSAVPGPEAGPGAAPVDAERTAVRWLALGLAWSIVALAAGAASLATVVAGLPNDHYHAFADPMVVVLVAIGVARLLGQSPAERGTAASGVARVGPAGIAGAAAAGVIVVALIGWNLATQPPAVAPDGGWAAARDAAARVIAAEHASPLVLSSLPTFKTDEALRMPLEAAGAELIPPGSVRPAGAATLVILCDQLFRESIGADCGGAAEDAWLADPRSGLLPAGASLAFAPTLSDRFEAAPGRWVSVYRDGP